MTRQSIYTLFLLLLFGNPLAAQKAFIASYTINESDESLVSQCLFRDRNGYLWTGTKGGLYRFDGRNFVNYMPDSIRNTEKVTALAADSLGRIHIGLASGKLALISQAGWTFNEPEEGWPKKPISDLLFDSYGALWIATADEGIYVSDGKRLTSINMDDGLPDNYVNALQGTETGTVLAGTDGGLANISFREGKKTVRVFSSREGLPDNIIRSISVSGSTGIYWLGTEDRGVLLFDAAKNTLVDLPAENPWTYGKVNDLLYDGSQAWASTENGGLVSLQVKNGRLHLRSSRLPDFQKPNRLALDNGRQLWVGIPGRLARSSILQVLWADSLDGKKTNPIHAIHAGHDGVIWYSMGNTLEKMEDRNGSWTHTGSYRFPGTRIEDVTSLYEDPQGTVWIGTIGTGVLRFDPSTGNWKKLQGNPVTENSHILSIAGKDETVWISGLNGVSRYDISDVSSMQTAIPYRNYGKRDGLGSDYVYQVFMDRENRPWFCTDGAGLAVLEGQQIRSFAADTGLASDVVYGMTQDEDGIYWINTLDNGVLRYDGRQFKPFYQLPGARPGTISSILSLGGHQLLLVHKRGVEVLDTHTGRTLHYGKNNGLTGAQVNLNQAVQDKTGAVWTASNQGIIQLNTHAFPSKKVPVTVINSLLVFDRETDEPNPVLAYDENNVSIRYEGLFFQDPDQVRFQYLLEGYHKEWVNSTDREVNFPRLQPGKFRFRVRSAADNRFELGEEASISFSILKPFWQQAWFIVGISALAVWLVSYLLSIRDRQLRRVEQLKREKIQAELQTLRAQVNPHFLFNSFNTLMGVLEEHPTQAIAYTEKLSAFYRNMLTHREKELISLEEELGLLETYLYLQQKRFGEALVYEKQVMDPRLLNHRLPPMTLQLLAENAIKHNSLTRERPLQFLVRAEGKGVRISNPIQRKKYPEKGEGIGLENIRSRFALYTSKPVVIEDDGIHFTISLPLIDPEQHAHPDH